MQLKSNIYIVEVRVFLKKLQQMNGLKRSTQARSAVCGDDVAVVDAVARHAVGGRLVHDPHELELVVVVGVIAVLIAVASMYSSWTLDQRADTVISPELQAQIDAIDARVEAGELDPSVGASDIIALTAQAQQGAKIVIDGKSSQGAGLGILTLALAVLGLAGAAVTGGVAGIDDRLRWIAGSLTMGLGAAVTGLSVAWVATLTRATDANFTSGVGLLMAMIAGVLIVSSVRSIVGEFERSKVYGAPSEVDGDPVVAAEAVAETVDA